MKSFELKLHRILVSTGMDEDKATELTETLSSEFKQHVRREINVATKDDIVLVRKDIEHMQSALSNQIRTLQWLFGAVGIPILVAIFLQFFR